MRDQSVKFGKFTTKVPQINLKIPLQFQEKLKVPVKPLLPKLILFGDGKIRGSSRNA